LLGTLSSLPRPLVVCMIPNGQRARDPGMHCRSNEGGVFPFSWNQGPVFRRIRRVSAVSPPSTPLERGGVWNGPDGRSDYSETDRGAQKRGGFSNGPDGRSDYSEIDGGARKRGGFSNGPKHNGPGFCKSCCQSTVKSDGTEQAWTGPNSRSDRDGPVFRQIRRVPAVRAPSSPLYAILATDLIRLCCQRFRRMRRWSGRCHDSVRRTLQEKCAKSPKIE
jgi:hypothetical protein